MKTSAEWLTLLHRCQNGDTTCMAVLHEIQNEGLTATEHEFAPGGKNLVDTFRDLSDNPHRRLKDWEEFSEILATRALTKKSIWPNDWHQDCAFVSFLLHTLEDQMAQLQDGRRIILPKTREHAAQMSAVAEHTIKTLGPA